MTAPHHGPAQSVRAPLPYYPPVHRSRRRTVALVVAGLIALGALGWQTSEYARESWWSSQPHEALGAGVHLQGFTVTSAEVTPLDSVETWEGPWPVPEGFQLWAVNLAVETHQDEIMTVAVYLEDAQGRVFEAAADTPSGVDDYVTMLEVAAPGPDDDPLPPVQRMLVLTPEDAVPAAVRVEGEYSLDPQFFRLPVQG